MFHSVASPFFWTSFIAVVLILLLLDLGLLHRRAHAVRLREAFFWSLVWVALSVSFGIWVSHQFGRARGLEFFTGYLIEYALSVDNIFVFILIFSYFKVPPRLHHRVLFWGILGALVMRATFIVVGAAILHAFHWMIYVFGAFLVWTGIKILQQGNSEIEPGRNPVLKVFQKFVPLIPDYESNGFMVRRNGKSFATPLALVLLTVETTDLVFATDSIPAIFGVTSDAFIVYTSNICAILGLRSMYFLLAAVIDRFVYLGRGLGIVLGFIGGKMLIGDFFKISIGFSLGAVVTILAGSILLSLLLPPGKQAAASNAESPLVRCDLDKE
jgi:tellurite resistance protein TerC